MKKTFKNLMLAVVLLVTSIGVNAQSQYWNVTGGNGGTNPATDYVGTNDGKPLVFRVNAIKAGRIDFANNIDNTSLGFQTLNPANPGKYNSAFGFQALKLNTGSYNTANGYQALFKNSTGNYNTAEGANALYSNATGFNNVANGFESLYSNTTGVGNVATGNQSLRYNLTGINNAATGYTSLFYNTAGSYNTAMGPGALYANIIGNNNTATGSEALNSNTANNNTANGYRSLYYNDTGTNNTALGYQSLYFTNEDQNTAVGYNALFYNISGANNTALGYAAGFSSTNNNLSYTTAIGANAVVTANNTMQLGTTTALIHTSNGYFVTSDGRFKDDVKESDAPGLDFINKLRPVSYKLNYKRYDDFIRKGMEGSKVTTDVAYQRQLIESGKLRQVGFIAQEVDRVVKDNNYTFNGVYEPQNSNDNYAIDYSKFVVPLVKAVQELSKENDDLKARLSAINARLDALENKSGSSAQIKTQAINNNNFHLYQIAPNPFSQKATISFSLPSYSSNAQLLITDATGKSLKVYTLSNGATQQEIDANNLAAGSYHYSLLVNGKIIDSKQMIVTK